MNKESNNPTRTETCPERTARPSLVTTAAVTWVVLGCLTLLMATAIVIVAALFILHPTSFSPGGSTPPSVVGGVVYGAIGIALLFAGTGTLRGTARDILGNSVGSLGFGAFPLVVGLLSLDGSHLISAGNLILLLMFVVPGLCLFAAGVLGLVARPGYKDWKASLAGTH